MCFAPYYSVNQLIEIKFILNKFARVNFDGDTNIVHVMKLKARYEKYLEDNENKDIEFPDHEIKFEER